MSGTTFTSESKTEKSFLSKIDSIFSLSSDFNSSSFVAYANCFELLEKIKCNGSWNSSKRK